MILQTDNYYTRIVQFFATITLEDWLLFRFQCTENEIFLIHDYFNFTYSNFTYLELSLPIETPWCTNGLLLVLHFAERWPSWTCLILQDYTEVRSQLLPWVCRPAMKDWNYPTFASAELLRSWWVFLQSVLGADYWLIIKAIHRYVVQKIVLAPVGYVIFIGLTEIPTITTVI